MLFNMDGEIDSIFRIQAMCMASFNYHIFHLASGHIEGNLPKLEQLLQGHLPIKGMS